jgi:hypothetical protein
MPDKKNRIPKKGDRVTAAGQQGTYMVYCRDHSLRTVDLKQIEIDVRLASIPWRSIKFLDEVDSLS